MSTRSAITALAEARSPRPAVVQRGAHGIALHHHGVHRAFDVGDQTLEARGSLHAQLNALFGALVMPSSLMR